MLWVFPALSEFLKPLTGKLQKACMSSTQPYRPVGAVVDVFIKTIILVLVGPNCKRKVLFDTQLTTGSELV